MEKETQGLTTKMRIKLFDQKTNLMVSDRLVEQATELLHGPKEVFNGRISLEVNLYSQTQVDMCIDYLKKLKGDVPLEAVGEKKVKKDKTIEKMLTEKEPLMDLIKTLKAKCTTQEKLINTLREYNFIFIAGNVIQDMIQFDPEGVGKQITLREKDIQRDYQYMVRLVKEAKEPMNDKYDFRLVFGIKIVGEKTDKVQLYNWGKYDVTWTIPWEKAKSMNFKKVEKIYIFPDFMDYDDRKKWRTEHRKKMKAEETNTAFEPSKFYSKFTPYIKGY